MNIDMLESKLKDASGLLDYLTTGKRLKTFGEVVGCLRLEDQNDVAGFLGFATRKGIMTAGIESWIDVFKGLERTYPIDIFGTGQYDNSGGTFADRHSHIKVFFYKDVFGKPIDVSGELDAFLGEYKEV